MIIIRISGGIGNQLFQYALGRTLSLKKGVELKLDISFYELGIEKDRFFELPKFNISAKIADDNDFIKIGVPKPKNQDFISKLTRRFYKSFGCLVPLEKRRMVVEQRFNFCPEILKIKDNCYLSGVWQSEKYFIDCVEQIKKDFCLLSPLGKASEQISQLITTSNSISIHVRRGDQVANQHLLDKHGYLGIDYYQKAVSHISRTTDSPQLFIFSDEIEWCKNNLIFDLPTTYVHGNEIKDYEELILMSRCKHNIIAKSSFSWWGAWLNQNPDKIVITPKKRFGAEELNNQDQDLIPDSWLKI